MKNNTKINIENIKYIVFKGGGGKGNAYLGVLKNICLDSLAKY